QLPVADVEPDHARCTALEEDVREAARRGADVDAVEAGRVDAETVEPVRELLSAARDVRRRGLDLELGALVHLLAGLVVTVDEAGEHERLGLRARLREAALDEQDVEAFLHRSRYPVSPRSQATSGSQPSMTSPKASRRA